MKKLSVKTSRKKEVVDITEIINRILAIQKKDEGVCNLFLVHTTAALTTADLDPGTDLDMLDVFEEMIPKLKFRHPHNPGHAKDHIISSVIGVSLAIPYESKKLILGTWQRVVLVELDGPREREIIVSTGN